MVKKWYGLLTTICFSSIYVSCSVYDLDGIFAADSSVQERFKNSMELPDRASHTEKIINSRDFYSFQVATDLHIRDTDWDNVGNFLTVLAGSGSSLAVLLGDYMYEAGSSLERFSDSINVWGNFHVFTAIGNHEIYKKGYQKTYRSTFGATCYYFKVETGNTCDLFIILDSANGTLGNDQFKWLQSLLACERASARHCFVFTHANFFNPSGYFDVISTYPVEEQMKLLDIFAKNDITAVFTGHSHVRDETTVRGVKYITLNSWGQGKRKGEYCQIECGADGKVSYSFL